MSIGNSGRVQQGVVRRHGFLGEEDGCCPTQGVSLCSRNKVPPAELTGERMEMFREFVSDGLGSGDYGILMLDLVTMGF